jgi:hypothetical protein
LISADARLISADLLLVERRPLVGDGCAQPVALRLVQRLEHRHDARSITGAYALAQSSPYLFVDGA